MKKILFVIAGLSLLGACQKAPSQNEIAARAAKAYYDQLLEGKYEQFVDGHYQPDSIPAVYREQLVANAKMFIGQQQDEHRGIRQVNVVRADVDTAKHAGNAFLTFLYGDSTSEEVVVPMVYQGGLWYLR
ncbi:hypothetical protein [Prevotella sp. KH2C16]|uniref:hypothetical protein n=1 Tax=Prevotella sp. KH2C16 TaxID=1855325 RepID=UPI0008EDFCAC|nr:hypothetical protein [Prevotella sp. KH2C16]SFG66410.1 hypothetical protein SAMN05216383_12710 [Prevotella sp. KH2C16]